MALGLQLAKTWRLAVDLLTALLTSLHTRSPAGTYSGAGASGCTPCPTGQYSPTTGMADQQVNNNGIRCLLCPRGSIALTVGETMNTSATAGANDFREERPLSTGATTCDAW